MVEIKIKRMAHLTKDAGKELFMSYEPETKGALLFLSQEIAEKKCELWVIQTPQKEILGYFITRIDWDDFVIVCGTSLKPKIDLTRLVVPAFEEVAKKVKCRRLRIHAKRKGIERKLLKMDYSVEAVVMFKEIN